MPLFACWNFVSILKSDLHSCFSLELYSLSLKRVKYFGTSTWLVKVNNSTKSTSIVSKLCPRILSVFTAS